MVLAHGDVLPVIYEVDAVTCLSNASIVAHVLEYAVEVSPPDSMGKRLVLWWVLLTFLHQISLEQGPSVLRKFMVTAETPWFNQYIDG